MGTLEEWFDSPGDTESRAIRKVGEHLWVGGEKDKPGNRVLVDVRNLPESPPSAAAISVSGVDTKMRRIDRAIKSGKDVLVRCKVGVSRSPTIAKLYLSGLGEKFNASGYFPNRQWKTFAEEHKAYYKDRRWDKSK